MGFFEDWEEEQRRRIEEANGNLKPWAEGTEIKGQPTDEPVKVQTIDYWRILQHPVDVNYNEYELEHDNGMTGLYVDHYVSEDRGLAYANFLEWVNSFGVEFTEIPLTSPWSYDLPFPNYKMRLDSLRSNAWQPSQGSIF